MPDFFEPKEPFPTSKHPPKTEQDGADLQAFFGPDGAAYAPPNIGKLTKLAQELKSAGANHVGVYGFCWGGPLRIIDLPCFIFWPLRRRQNFYFGRRRGYTPGCCCNGSPCVCDSDTIGFICWEFEIRMLSADDASKLTVPLGMYITKDEDVKEVSVKAIMRVYGQLTNSLPSTTKSRILSQRSLSLRRAIPRTTRTCSTASAQPAPTWRTKRIRKSEHRLHKILHTQVGSIWPLLCIDSRTSMGNSSGSSGTHCRSGWMDMKYKQQFEVITYKYCTITSMWTDRFPQYIAINALLCTP